METSRRRPVRTVALGLAAALALTASPATTSESAASATTRYVAPGGAPVDLPGCSGGTEAAPWGSLKNAMRCLRPGDTLVVAGGRYRQDVNPPTTSATADEPILVTNAPGERVVVEGRLWLTHNAVSGFDHWTIRGINVTSSSAVNHEWLVKFRGGRHWTYEDSEVWNANMPKAFGAVRVEDPRDDENLPGVPANWTLRDLCVHDTPDKGREAFQDHNLYVDTGVDAGPGLIDRVLAFEAPDGNNLKLGPEAANITVRRSTFVDASQNLLVDGASSNILLEDNLVGIATGKDWYPNIRGSRMTGTNVRARDNGGFASGSTGVLYTHGVDSATAITDLGGNVAVGDPAFRGSGCGGFEPTTAAAAGYGHRSAALDRRAGDNRVDTAARLTRSVFTDPADVETVVLGRADAYADSLAAAPLAADAGGPVLLTDKDRLSTEAADELRRLRPTRVLLVGGPGALSDDVAADVRAIGITDVQRLAGPDRFATAAAVAAQLPASDEAFVVEGANANSARGWPDALSAAGLAAHLRDPILLVTRDQLPEPTRRALLDRGVERVTIVGGTAAVSAEVADAIADPDRDGTDEVEVVRIAGSDRVDTSARVAQASLEAGASTAPLLLASANNWPDALAAAPAAAHAGGSLLLVPAQAWPDGNAAAAFLTRNRAGAEPVLVGGRGAISGGVERGVAASLDG